MNILFVDDNAEIRDLLIFSLLSHTDFVYKEASNGRDAMDMLSVEKFDFVVCDLNMPNGSGNDVYRHVRNNKIPTRMAFMGNEAPEKGGEITRDPTVIYLRKPFAFEDLQHLAKLLTENVSQVAKDYLPVTLNFLKRIRNIEAPLFIRINDHKFVRLTNGPITFGPDEYERYHHRGLNELFVEAMMADNLVSDFSKRVFSNDAWQEAGSANHDHIHINADLVRSICSSMNWSEEKINQVLDSAHRALHIIRSQPNLTKVFHQFQKIEKWGLSDHAALILTMSAGLAEKLGHTDNATIQKITFAALLHDMTLTDLQYDAKPKLLEKARQRDANPSKDVRDIVDHPALASQICKKIPVCPPEVDQIIFNHHERPDGKGFPMGKRADEIPFLSALIIFSEDFTETFIEHAGRVDLEGFAQSRSNTYSQGHFRLILEAFKQAIAPPAQIAS